MTDADAQPQTTLPCCTHPPIASCRECDAPKPMNYVHHGHDYRWHWTEAPRGIVVKECWQDTGETPVCVPVSQSIQRDHAAQEERFAWLFVGEGILLGLTICLGYIVGCWVMGRWRGGAHR